MNQTIRLDIPADAATRARRNVISEILRGLIAHSLTIDQAVQAIEHLVKAETDQILERCHLSNRAQA